MSIYDQYYQSADLFGAPYPELIAFFEEFYPKGRLLDLGCGQGRNAISLARMGYEVVGIDNSKVGIDQMNSLVCEEALSVDGRVGDIYAFEHFDEFDVVLLDSMFHFHKKDRTREVGLIQKIFTQLTNGGLLCICIQDIGKKIEILHQAIKDTSIHHEVLKKSSFTYQFMDKQTGHISKTPYVMIVWKKV